MGENVKRRRNARRYIARVCKQAGSAKRNACGRGDREARPAQHAKQAVVHSVSVRNHRRWSVRGSRLALEDALIEEVTWDTVQCSKIPISPPRPASVSTVLLSQVKMPRCVSRAVPRN